MLINIHTHTKATDNVSIYNLATWNDEFEIENQNYSVGLHPWYLNDNWKSNFEKVKASADNDNCLAIGECGLDKVCDTSWELQMEVFKAQITFAIELQKPIIIHCVRAFSECETLLQKLTIPVIFHGFNKNIALAEQLIQKGFYLSFHPHFFTKKATQKLPETYLDKIFLETDDTTFTIEEVYKMGANYFDIDVKILSLQIEKNYQKVLKKNGE